MGGVLIAIAHVQGVVLIFCVRVEVSGRRLEATPCDEQNNRQREREDVGGAAIHGGGCLDE